MRSGSASRAVRNRTGLVTPRARRAWQTSRPSASGRPTSRTSTSGGSAPNARTASLPEAVARTVSPSRSRALRSTPRRSSSSSQTPAEVDRIVGRWYVREPERTTGRDAVGRMGIPRQPMYARGMRADLLRGHLDGLLLAVLADAPAHGYELGQRLAQRSGGELDVPEGSLYPALHRLERGGLVASVWRTGDGRRRRVYRLRGGGGRVAVLWPTDDGPRRRVYRLTRSGRRAVSASREEWRAFSSAVGRVLG